jgi:hypothetical protein
MDAPPTEVPHLHAGERRVLGVLIEKGMTTPEYYPLTVNALIAGCNQKNNREPVTSLDEDSVMAALRSLEAIGLAASVIADTGRVNRWRQDLGRKFELNAVQTRDERASAARRRQERPARTRADAADRDARGCAAAFTACSLGAVIVASEGTSPGVH